MRREAMARRKKLKIKQSPRPTRKHPLLQTKSKCRLISQLPNKMLKKKSTKSEPSLRKPSEYRLQRPPLELTKKRLKMRLYPKKAVTRPNEDNK